MSEVDQQTTDQDKQQADHFSDVDLNTSLEAQTPSTDPLSTDHDGKLNQEPTLEFFGNGQEEGGGSETDSNPSLKQGGEREKERERDKDDDSNNDAFVTLSPPLSPATDDVDSNLLESLDEDSVDSPDVVKSKLDTTPNQTMWSEQKEERKRLDFESPIAGPGKERRILGPGLSEEQGQDVDLKVGISERKEKMGPKSDLYVTYKICTDTTRPAHLFEESHYEVWRRYRDFEWLREMMEKEHPTLIIPPLPGKQLTRYFDHKSQEFLEERQKALDKFLKRLTAHPYFSFDTSLKKFLTLGDEEFTSHVAETSKSSRLLGAVTSSMKQATTAFMLKNADPYYSGEAKYLSELAERFAIAERVGTRIHSEREELAAAKEDLSSAMIHWAAIEPHLEQPIRKFGSCVENCTTALKSLNSSNAYSVLLTAKEYQLYCASGVSAIRRRDALQLEKGRTSDDREKKKKVHDDAATAGKLQKLPKLADELQKASVTADKALDDLTKANEELRVDIEKWKEAKNKDLSQFMVQFSDNHIDYHQKCFDEWEIVLKMLKSPQILEELESSSSEGLLTPTLLRADMEFGKEEIEKEESYEEKKEEEKEETKKEEKEEEKDSTSEGGVESKEDHANIPIVPTPGLFDNEEPDTDLFSNQS